MAEESYRLEFERVSCGTLASGYDPGVCVNGKVFLDGEVYAISATLFAEQPRRYLGARRVVPHTVGERVRWLTGDEWLLTSTCFAGQHFAKRLAETAELVLEDGVRRLASGGAELEALVASAGLQWGRGCAGLEELSHFFGDCHRGQWHPTDAARRACGDPRCAIAATERGGGNGR